MIPAVVAMAMQSHGELESAIQLARKNSPVLASARADLEVVVQDRRIAQSSMFPQAVVSGWTSIGTDSGVMTGAPELMPSPLMLLPNGSFSVANLSVMMPIYSEVIRGKLATTSWQVKAATFDYKEAVADLNLRVTESYFKLQLALQKVLLKRAAVAASEELVRNSQLMLEAGKGIQADIQRSESEKFRADRDLRMAENDSAKAEIDLNETLGISLNHHWTSAAIPSPTTQAGTVEVCIEQALHKRPLKLAAECRLKALRNDLGARRAEGKPQIYGGLMADRSRRADMGGITGALVLSIPVFDGGRVRAEVKQGRVQVNKGEAQLQITQLQIEREVRQAWLDRETAMANLASAESSVSAAQAAYEIISLRVHAGKSILLEQLDGLSALNSAKADSISARYDLAMATARLNRTMGGAL